MQNHHQREAREARSLPVAAGRRVTFELTIATPRGVALTKPSRRTTVHGRGTLSVGLERALVGKHRGDQFELVLAPEEAFGHRRARAFRTVPRDAFDQLVEPGACVSLATVSGRRETFWVVEVNEDELVLDANHPLAGLTLVYRVAVLDVREEPRPLRAAHAESLARVREDAA